MKYYSIGASAVITVVALATLILMDTTVWLVFILIAYKLFEKENHL